MRRLVAILLLTAGGSSPLAAASCPMVESRAHHGVASVHVDMPSSVEAPDHRAHDHAPERPDRSCSPVTVCGSAAAAPAAPARLAAAAVLVTSTPTGPRHATDAPGAQDPPPPRLPV